jgi:hypothetical protein
MANKYESVLNHAAGRQKNGRNGLKVLNHSARFLFNHQELSP